MATGRSMGVLQQPILRNYAYAIDIDCYDIKHL